MKKIFIISFVAFSCSQVDSSIESTKNNESLMENKMQEPEQAVIIYFDYGIQELSELHNLEERLEEAIENAGTGEYDGHEIALDYSDGILYMYGPSADSLYKSVKPILEQTNFMKGGKAKLRFGPPEDGVTEIIVEI